MRQAGFLFLALAGVGFAQTAAKVEKKDMTSVTKFEQVLSGHLAELNGKYKIRITETAYAPGGFIGEHHHAGPGVRMIQSGELTYVRPDGTTVYKAGDYFYESGDVSHTAYNRTDKPVVLLNFEILPADWKGASTILVPQK